LSKECGNDGVGESEDEERTLEEVGGDTKEERETSEDP
jgi:hypothetical protein